MPRPDVALIAPYPTGGNIPDESGVAPYTRNLARALAREGARPVVVAPLDCTQSVARDDGDVHVERRFRPGAKAVPAAVNSALGTGAPVVHLQHEHFLYGGPRAIPGLLWGLRRGRSSGRGVVVTAHQVVPPSNVDRAFTSLHRMRVPPVAARIGLGTVQELLAKFSSRMIVHEQQFAEVIPGAAVIPHGVERVVPMDRRTARSALGIDRRLVCLCFGFVAPYKGLETALDAAARAGDRIELVIAGGPHPRHEDRESYARDLQGRWRHTARWTGYVEDADVATWFSAADVVLLPYPRPHASSGALALAIAYGIPFLASPALGRCAGIPDAAVYSGDSDDLSNRLRLLQHDSTALDDLRAVSRSMATERAWESVARRHLDVYEEVQGGNRSRNDGRAIA